MAGIEATPDIFNSENEGEKSDDTESGADHNVDATTHKESYVDDIVEYAEEKGLQKAYERLDMLKRELMVTNADYQSGMSALEAAILDPKSGVESYITDIKDDAKERGLKKARERLNMLLDQAAITESEHTLGVKILDTFEAEKSGKGVREERKKTPEELKAEQYREEIREAEAMVQNRIVDLRSGRKQIEDIDISDVEAQFEDADIEELTAVRSLLTESKLLPEVFYESNIHGVSRRALAAGGAMSVYNMLQGSGALSLAADSSGLAAAVYLAAETRTRFHVKRKEILRAVEKNILKRIQEEQKEKEDAGDTSNQNES